MEETIKNKFGLSTKGKVYVVSGLVTFCLVSVIIFFGLFTVIKGIVTRQAINSITNISELNIDSISKSINNKRTLLETFSIDFARKKTKNRKEILEAMSTYVTTHKLYSLGILEKDFTLCLTTGEVIDVSGWTQFEDAWDEEFHMSESYLPAAGGEYTVNLLSYPVCFDGKLQYVLIAGGYSKNLTESMNLSSMGGKGYSYLLNSKGDIVIYPKFYKGERYNGLMKYLNDTSDVIPNETGDRYFEYDGEKYYAHFEKMELNDWYLMTCAREKDVFAEANRITYCVLLGMGLLWIMMITAVCGTVYSLYRSQLSLKKAMFYDNLLGIGNSEFLMEFFNNTPEKERLKMVLTIFDIDKFKEFNYIYGEDCGDHLLSYIVEVFREELPGEYLFRYMSDNFGAMIYCRSKEEITQKLEHLLHRFSADIDAGKIQPFDISAGVRKVRKGDSFQRVLSDALIAKGTIKGIQVQQYAFYDENIRNKRMSYMEMESDFSRALKDREFHVYYQPKYDMRTGKIIGAEALVRWVKSDGTVISPGAFIPCFEASRQIIMLDEVMLESVCRQMEEMKDEGLDVKKVSVNLSRVHLRHRGILPKIEAIVKSADIDPEKLSFEITESALYEDSIPLKDIVDFIHGLGCRVDMDDYGVGVSGPNSLASNQFDIIKLDKSFIDGIGDKRMESVIRSTIQLSRELGMEILAEGVEERYQADSLVEWGCNMAQGFYYSPPVPEEEYKEMLRKDSGTSGH